MTTLNITYRVGINRVGARATRPLFPVIRSAAVAASSTHPNQCQFHSFSGQQDCSALQKAAWEVYETVIPAKRLRVVGKEIGLTSYIERFNNTLRPRVSRLVRKNLSFSKNQENHVGAIWNFIHDYNQAIRRKLMLDGYTPTPFSTSLN